MPGQESDKPNIFRHDKRMSDAWLKCVAFNNKHAVGSKVIYVTCDNQQKKVIVTDTPAYVINDTPVISSENIVYKLEQIIY